MNGLETLALPRVSIEAASRAICAEGETSWKLWLAQLVDDVRAARDASLIDQPPVHGLSPRLRALLASTTEALCAELALAPPAWCLTVPGVAEPWFVAGVENLKASALVESPAHFRQRNIFVLGNFLSRA